MFHYGMCLHLFCYVSPCNLGSDTIPTHAHINEIKIACIVLIFLSWNLTAV